MIEHKSRFTITAAEKLLNASSPRIPTFSRYCRDVIAGNIPVGRLVFLAVERHLRDLETGHQRGLRFDQNAAARIIKFFRDFAPFKLEPFQQFKAGSLFGWKGADGYRRFRTAYIEEGKGSGKTPWGAGVLTYGLLADGEPEAEIYCAAVTKEQAGISYRDAEIMRSKSPLLKEKITKHRNNLSVASTNSFLRPISSEHRGLDGKRPHMVLLDEVHEHPTDLVVEKMRAGTKARRQALIIEITNSGSDRETVCFHDHEYSRKILEEICENDAWFAYVCHLDACEDCQKNGHVQPNGECNKCDSWLDPDVWVKANPGVDTILPRKYLQERVTIAVASPDKENIVRRLNFCMWTQADVRAIGAAAWMACAGVAREEDPVKVRERWIEEMRGFFCYGGIDLGCSDDLTCGPFLLFPKQAHLLKARVLPWFFTPRASVALRTQQDRVPYDVWERQGFLKVTEGNVRDDSFIRKQINASAAMFDIREIHFDPYRALLLVNELLADGLKMVAHRQGFISMHDPVDGMLAMVRGAEFEHGNNPVLTWMADNLVVVSDAAGNLKPQKPENPKSPKKIDGMVAFALAKGAQDANPGDGGSVYETRGVLVI